MPNLVKDPRPKCVDQMQYGYKPFEKSDFYRSAHPVKYQINAVKEAVKGRLYDNIGNNGLSKVDNFLVKEAYSSSEALKAKNANKFIQLLSAINRPFDKAGCVAAQTVLSTTQSLFGKDNAPVPVAAHAVAAVIAGAIRVTTVVAGILLVAGTLAALTVLAVHVLPLLVGGAVAHGIIILIALGVVALAAQQAAPYIVIAKKDREHKAQMNEMNNKLQQVLDILNPKPVVEAEEVAFVPEDDNSGMDIADLYYRDYINVQDSKPMELAKGFANRLEAALAAKAGKGAPVIADVVEAPEAWDNLQGLFDGIVAAPVAAPVVAEPIVEEVAEEVDAPAAQPAPASYVAQARNGLNSLLGGIKAFFNQE